MQELDDILTMIDLDLPEGILHAGSAGTIVAIWADGAEYLVEFDAPWHVVPMNPKDVRLA